MNDGAKIARLSSRPLRILIVGRGLIGGALAHYLRKHAVSVLSVGRRGSPDRNSVAIDLETPEGLDALSDLIGTFAPDSLILVHGPTDVAWCENHFDASLGMHQSVAIVSIASGTRTILVSTDNVFDGSSEVYDEGAEVMPANAYGAVKRAAEMVVENSPQNTVIRVSLVYGKGPGRETFATSCLVALRAGATLDVPNDQFFTPVYIEDVVYVLAVLASNSLRPPLLHLGGPTRMSRYDFARLVQRLSGLGTDRVVGLPKARTRWASRPHNSCLCSTLITNARGLEDFRPMPPEAGLRLMLAADPNDCSDEVS